MNNIKYYIVINCLAVSPSPNVKGFFCAKIELAFPASILLTVQLKGEFCVAASIVFT